MTFSRRIMRVPTLPEYVIQSYRVLRQTETASFDDERRIYGLR